MDHKGNESIQIFISFLRQQRPGQQPRVLPAPRRFGKELHHGSDGRRGGRVFGSDPPAAQRFFLRITDGGLRMIDHLWSKSIQIHHCLHIDPNPSKSLVWVGEVPIFLWPWCVSGNFSTRLCWVRRQQRDWELYAGAGGRVWLGSQQIQPSWGSFNND